MNDQEVDETAEEYFQLFMIASEGITGINLEKMIHETSLSQKEAQAILEIIKINYMTGFKSGYASAN